MLTVSLSGLLLLGLSGSTAGELGVGERLPALKGEYLTGRKATLPDDASGKVRLLAIGFTYDSRFAVEAWVKKFRKDFGSNPRISFYEIPMIGGMAQMGKWFIDSGMRRGTPKEDQENVITVYGNTGPWKERLGFKAPDSAYLILLDQSGIVSWRHTGIFDENAYRGLEEAVKRLVTK